MESRDGSALAALRGEIDRIDEAMHALLMERGAIIDRLIEAKRTAVSGSAFRPGREAAMMCAIAARHRGILPVEAAEAIWRIIISTFTHVQAPFRVHADVSGDAAAMRDTARFHFGFVPPYVPASDAETAIAAVAASHGDLGLVPLGRAGSAWWRTLEPKEAPKAIAILPFAARAGHPAGLPTLVIARRPSDEAAGLTLLSVRSNLPDPGPLAAIGGDILATASGDALIAVPAATTSDQLAAALEHAQAVTVGDAPARA